MLGAFSSVVSALRHHAAVRPGARAYAFLADRGGEEQSSLTFGELDRSARILAAHLGRRGQPGDRALLLFPPGLDFLVGLFGCFYAGMIAVPMMPPRRHRLRESTLNIAADCRPTFGLTVKSLLEANEASLAQTQNLDDIEWVACDTLIAQAAAEHAVPAPGGEPEPATIAFLQYTSGSTSMPKGVMVSHGNLAANLEMIRGALSYDHRSTHVNWVPLYHDMGLVLNALETCYVGAQCVLMAPVAFMQRPLSWLAAISRYRAEAAGGPNFAFDLCVERSRRGETLDGLDLSCWRVAINGAEPVRPETLARFNETFATYGLAGATVQPSYGMAEATLLISGGLRSAPVYWEVSRKSLQLNRAVPPEPGEGAQALVGCGKALQGERIAIVDPTTLHRLPAGDIGEIWVHGPNVAQGYWGNAEASLQVFHARVVGEGEESWLRTGDLGCLDNTGELFVTGRIKDLLIVRGENHYPQDIERTAEQSHKSLRPHCSAVFVGSRGDTDLLVIVLEVDRTGRWTVDLSEIAAAVRQAVFQEHDITVNDVVLIRTGSIPKTTSGKIRRSFTRELWSNNELEVWTPADKRPETVP
jgi:acyl-CoA synthetase (AMP-forming)/AMP-acid ligase II